MPKLVLFDIDETMVSSHGAGRRALERALTVVFNRAISLNGLSLSGKTDPQICFEALAAYDFEKHTIVSCLEQIYASYLPALQDEVRQSKEFKLHAGVVELLEQLKVRDDAYLGLLTGNIELGAQVKLRKFGLDSYFAMGAFGSDSHDRMELPAVAHERAASLFKQNFKPEDLVIIGDARNDVLCAKGYGATSIAVATGKTTKETLQELKPDHLFDDLSQTPQVLSAIFAK
jgi:phosphoglycolate phosphatase